MVPDSLAWVRAHGAKLHSALRHRLLVLCRPPRWLPCWFHGLWYIALARLMRVRVIIGLRGDGAELQDLLRRHRCRTTRRLDRVGLVCTVAPVGALRHLCGCGAVDRLWLDREVWINLDAAVAAAGAVEVRSRYNGQGITIAIIDTGVYPHPDLAGRIVAFADFVTNRTAPYDDNGHGTHVAGCAAGSGAESGGQYRGVAPGARLVGIKVLNKTGAGTVSDILAGIDWVVQNRVRYGIRVLSMSLGAQAQSGCTDDPLCRAAGQAWKAGITVVAAAGNEGPEPGTISTPGISPEVITVGAMDDRGTPDRGDDAIAAFSSRGPTRDGRHKPDLLAPGVAVTSLRSPGSTIDKQNEPARVGRWYLTLSGTSMATPIVAGVVALLLEAEPWLTPDQVKARLLGSAEDRGLAADDQGAGYVHSDRCLF